MNTPEQLPLAVALKYDGDSAPKVTAKGKGEIAKQIIELADEHDIPMYEDSSLVGLLTQVELGDEIPEELYVVVAEVIAFAFSITGKQIS